MVRIFVVAYRVVHFVAMDRVGCVVGMVLGGEHEEVWWMVGFC